MGRAKTNAKNFITTSSGIDINPDLYRRVLKTSMNHSTELTKQVMAKKIHDAAYPDSLKAILGLEEQLPFTEKDFQNALSLINWKLEVAAFTPPKLLELLDLAVKREQEVALRTHLEKIVNFTKVLALLNQSERLRARIGEAEYVVAEPQDFQTALQILSASIRETICRIEKRQEEALQLFTPGVSLTKNDVAIKLKVSTRTANRVLKTLSQAGYLKEDVSSKAYRYELLEKEPEHHALLEMARSLGSFHQSSLEVWLNTIVTSGQEKQLPTSFCVDGAWTSTPPQILDEVTMEDPNLEDQSTEASVSEEVPDGTDLAVYGNNDRTTAEIGDHELCGKREEDIADANNAQTPKNNDPPDLNIACPDVTMPFTPKTSLNSEEADIDHANLERARLIYFNSEMNTEKPFLSLRQLASAQRTYTEREHQKCQVCGKTTLTSCQAETFSGTSVWLCEDCYEMWNRHVGTEQG
jgi:DNA-binding transcriptional regulator YhcF (GntR family)